VDVSIVVATYNVAGYIQRTVQSALDQWGPTLEVIVVDDCSTDTTWDVVSHIGDPRVKTRRLSANGGPSVARNAGIAMASGAWIAVLDGDDRFLPGRLQACLALAKARHADIVVDNLVVARESDGGSFPMFADAVLQALDPLDLARFIRGNRLFAPGYSLGYLKPLFRAAFLREHGLSYDPALRIGEDYLLFAQALASGATCAVQPTPGYAYTVRTGSISHRLGLADIARMEASDRKLLAQYTLDGDAARAQAVRSQSLREAAAYTMLVDAVKQRSVAGVVRAIRHCPAGMRYAWWPVHARLMRLRAALPRRA
jgi:succinoglycan biosynthesis protein ExoO